MDVTKNQFNHINEKIKETNKEELYHVAEELGVDPEAYYEAAKKVKVLPKETVDKAAKFLYSIANILSNMAYSKYLAHKAKEEIQQIYKGIRKDYLLEDTCASDNDEVCQ